MDPEEPHGKLPPGFYFLMGGDAPDHKRASFRLMGERLDPDATTRATGLTPGAPIGGSEANRTEGP
jgi:hypothetical protein